MLKLKRTSASTDLSIIVQDRGTLFTPSLIQAFAFAASFHLLFLILFQIAPLKMRWKDTIYPPVQVEAQTDFNDLNLVVDFTSMQKVSSGLPPAPTSLPSLEPQRLANRVENVTPNTIPSAPTPTFSFSPPRQPPPITIVVSGLLAESGEIDRTKELPKIRRSDFKINRSEYRTTYKVAVESASGKVYWYDPIESTGSPALDRAAERIVRVLKFTFPNAEKFNRDRTVTGTIEIQLNLEEEHTS